MAHIHKKSAAGQLAGFLSSKDEAGKDILDWPTFWYVPAIGVFVSLLVFVVLFRTPKEEKTV